MRMLSPTNSRRRVIVLTTGIVSVFLVCAAVVVILCLRQEDTTEQILSRVREPKFVEYYPETGNIGLFYPEALLWAEKVNEEELEMMPYYREAIETNDTQRALGLACIMIASESYCYLQDRAENLKEVPEWELALWGMMCDDAGVPPGEKYREELWQLLKESDSPIARLFRAGYYGQDLTDESIQTYLDLLERDDWIAMQAGENLLKNGIEEKRAARRMRELSAQGVPLDGLQVQLLEEYEEQKAGQ